MEERFKDRAIIIVALLSLIFFIASLGAASNARKQRGFYDKERIARMDLEEKLDSLLKEKNSLSTQLEEEKTSHDLTKKLLVEEQAYSKTLNEELNKMTKLKEQLEKDLKEALVAK